MPKGTEKRKEGKPLSPSKLRLHSAKQDVINLLQMGYHTEDIITALVDKYGYTRNSAEEVTLKAARDIKAKFTDYRDKIAERNMKRLETIIEEAYRDGEKKTALLAIDQLSKLTGLYQEKVKIESDNPIFEVKIGE